MRPVARHRGHGASLVEALVALAVMALGMLGVVGVQSTLRLNSDVARQRSEAVRLAQRSIEDARSFTLVEPSGGLASYGDLGELEQAIASPSAGTAYTLTREVAATGGAGDSDESRLKTLRVKVSWSDRTGAAQSVELNTAVARVMPELAGTLALATRVSANGVPASGPANRNPVIPTAAVDFGLGASGYLPPNRPAGDQTAWLFDNLSGLITLCTSSETNNALLILASQLTCGSATAWPLSGTVVFATDAAPASALDAAQPSGAPQAVRVGVTQTFPAGVGSPACYTSAPVPGQPVVTYVCALPVSGTSTPAAAWSGYSYVNGAGITGAAGGYSVCRYTAGPPAVAARGNLVVPAISNAQHPRAYHQAGEGLPAQNLLVVPYAAGGAADCPDGSPLPAGWTTYPQPSTPP